MLRKLFKLIFQLVAAAIFLFLGIAAVIIFNGLNDEGQKADCALVAGHEEYVHGQSDAQLDLVVKLYNDGAFPYVIIIGTKWKEIGSNGETMVQYLERHGLPATAIIDNSVEDTARAAAVRVEAIMKSHGFQSVMVVADYYRLTRLKLALNHEGVANVEKSHVGKLQREDALKIGREVAALCDYVGHVYLLPAAEKAKEEAQVGMDKASTEAEKAKDKVNKSLDNMAK